MTPRDEQLEDAYLTILALRALLEAEQSVSAHLRARLLCAMRASDPSGQADGDAGPED